MPYADLLQKFINITKLGTFIPKPNAQFAHCIVTRGPSVTERFRKLFGEKATAARAEIQRPLDNKVVRPPSSAWASPIHMVKRKDNTYRLCGNYRKLNSLTIPDKYAPPLVQNLFLILHGKSVFSTIDLDKAYNQIPVHKNDVPKTAIATPWGLYKYVGMLFGRKMQLRHSKGTRTTFSVIWTLFSFT